MARDVQWRFVANRWLAMDEGDKKIVVELPTSNDDGQDGMRRGNTVWLTARSCDV